MNSDEFTRAVINELAEYLEAEMASITTIDQILQEWPEANRELPAYPAISIITPGDVPLTPWQGNQKISGVVNPGDPNLFDYKYAVGQYELALQIDIWTDYKNKRHKVFQEFFAAFHKNLVDQGHSGVNLSLLDYHGQPVHYMMTGYNYGDSEEASQRKEWRVKIDVEVIADAILEATQAAMIDNQSVTEIGEQTKIE